MQILFLYSINFGYHTSMSSKNLTEMVIFCFAEFIVNLKNNKALLNF